MAYYFLVAQLPHLNYGQEAPLSADSFLALCSDKLSKADAALLPYCRLGMEDAEEDVLTASDFINKWRRRERSLALNLARGRAAKLKREAPNGDVPLDAEAEAKLAAALDNPLEAELAIDKGRWEALESFCGVDYFGVNVVYAYLLKTEEGFAEYKALYAGILENAPRFGA